MIVGMCQKMKNLLQRLTTNAVQCDDALADSSDDYISSRVYTNLSQRKQTQWLSLWYSMTLTRELRKIQKCICGVEKYYLKHKWKSKVQQRLTHMLSQEMTKPFSI